MVGDAAVGTDTRSPRCTPIAPFYPERPEENGVQRYGAITAMGSRTLAKARRTFRNTHREHTEALLSTWTVAHTLIDSRPWA
jgi:hypothetical protein